MDVLIHHRELAEGDFPDACVRCGAGDTEHAPIVLTTSMPVLGGHFRYTNVELPFCPDHVVPPLVSFHYPGVREFTAEGIIVKNVAGEFAAALKDHRARTRRRRQHQGQEEPPADTVLPGIPVDPTPEQERAYRRFVVFAIVAAVLLGLLVGGLVLLVTPRKNDPAPAKGAPPPGRKG